MRLCQQFAYLSVVFIGHLIQYGKYAYASENIITQKHNKS